MDITFRFPIALLAYEPNHPRMTMDRIMDWCVYEAGLARIGEMTTDEDAARFTRHQAPAECDRYYPADFGEYVACLGAQMLRVDYGEICWVPKNHGRLQAFLEGRDKASARNMANVSEEWFWSCFDTLRGETQDRTLSWREFRVLAAILSKVGNKSHARCGWKEIQARAAGWCGKVSMDAAGKLERQRRRPLELTRDMIRYTLDRLEADRFFARFRYARSQTWFSFSCGQDRTALASLVGAGKTRRVGQVAAYAVQDRTATEKIQAQVRAKSRQIRLKPAQPPVQHAGGAA